MRNRRSLHRLRLLCRHRGAFKSGLQSTAKAPQCRYARRGLAPRDLLPVEPLIPYLSRRAFAVSVLRRVWLAALLCYENTEPTAAHTGQPKPGPARAEDRGGTLAVNA